MNANIKTWQERLPLCPRPEQLQECMAAEIGALRAALASAQPSTELMVALERFIKCKGRYHTEQNYVALVAAYDASLLCPPAHATPHRELSAIRANAGNVAYLEHYFTSIWQIVDELRATPRLDIQALAANVRGAMQETGGEVYRQALYDTILRADAKEGAHP